MTTPFAFTPELTADDLAAVDSCDIDAAAERRRLVALMRASGSALLERQAARMENCGRFNMALTRMGDDGRRSEGRSLVIGCRVRICPMCNANRRSKYDRQLRPQILACQEMGHQALFATFTRHPLYGQPMRYGFADMREAFGAMRRGRAKWQRWAGMIAGGMYGLEQTLYGRYPKSHPKVGEIRVLANGSLDRRVHAHVHTVLLLQPHADPAVACELLKDWWLDECEERGWRAVREAQDVQLVSRERLEDDRDPASYCVKYIGKPGDIRTPDDALEVLSGCKGVHQVQTFGCLHGSALIAHRCAAGLVDEQIELPIPVNESLAKLVDAGERLPADMRTDASGDRLYLPLSVRNEETAREVAERDKECVVALNAAVAAVRNESADAAHPHRVEARVAE